MHKDEAVDADRGIGSVPVRSALLYFYNLFGSCPTLHCSFRDSCRNSYNDQK